MASFFCILVLLIVVSSIISVYSNSLSVKPRDQAPGFKSKGVIDDVFIDIQLSYYLEQNKWVVLLFYPFGIINVTPSLS